jgi:hypothetical protein
MIVKGVILVAVSLLALAGCATPSPVKQTLVDIDKGYAENARMMEQYRTLVENVNERLHYWYRYVRQRLLLDLTLRSAAQDYWGSDPIKVDDTATLLGEDLVRLVNELRLAGLPAAKDSTGNIKFAAGKPGNTADKVAERLPEIVNRVVGKVDEDYVKVVVGDMSQFDVYRTNVSGLRQINGAIRRYLDIDVTISPQDVSEIADSIRQLRH